MPLRRSFGIVRNQIQASSFVFSLIAVAFLSFLSARGNTVAKEFLSEQLQPRHFELYVYVLMIFQGLSIASASRSWRVPSTAFSAIARFLLPFYVGIVGAIVGWGIGAMLAGWPNAPFSGYVLIGLFLLMCSVVLFGATSTEFAVKKITEFSTQERKHEGFVRVLGFLLAAYGAFSVFLYLGA